MMRSMELHDRGMRVFPGGLVRHRPAKKHVPLYASHGEGAHVVDVDGTRSLDFVNNHASLVHGHAHPCVVEVLRQQVSHGTTFGAPTEHEVTLAEAICGRAKGFEQIKFFNASTDAVAAAIALAQSVTQRSAVAMVSGVCHGHGQGASTSAASFSVAWPGGGNPVAHALPARDGHGMRTLTLPFNDVAAAERILLAHAEEVSAVVLDAAPSALGFERVSQPFIEMLQRVTRQVGAVFVLDEVMSFRSHPGGAQTLLGIEPDITVLGGFIGGGFSLGAVVGRHDFMSDFDPSRAESTAPTFGAFHANPMAMAAGKVTLDLLDASAIESMEILNRRLVDGLNRVFEGAGFPAQARGFGSSFRIFGHAREIDNDFPESPVEQARVMELRRALSLEGFHICRDGSGFLSSPMLAADLDAFLKVLESIVNS